MDLANMFLLILIVVLAVIYLVLIPIFRRKNIKQQQNKMDTFYKSLKRNDTVLLTDGITGVIKSINGDKIKLEIANNVLVNVNKYGIISKVEDEANEK